MSAIGLAGLGYSIVAGRQAREEQKSIDAYNARVRELESEDALERGRIEEALFRTNAKKLIGSQKTSLAAQGIEIDEGSALDVLADTAENVELDAQTIRSNAKREAWGIKVQAQSILAQSKVNQTASENREVSTILQGAASIYDNSPSTNNQTRSGTVSFSR